MLVKRYGRRERDSDARHQQAGEQPTRHRATTSELLRHEILSLHLSLEHTPSRRLRHAGIERLTD